ncbi:hypothetical protein MUTS15_32030 [Escherichia coli]|nr:hypothetical protein MUTS15_32030 [Escherichia coli]BDZ03153.1 hypothetical protein MUTS16_42260 [Escherichia coli]
MKNFQPDTIKIVYDENNIIVAITKDASTLNPEGYSVVEIPDITANRRADDSGKWMFKDGAVIKRVYTEEELRLQTENQKKYYYSRPEKNAVLANTAYFGDYH